MRDTLNRLWERLEPKLPARLAPLPERFYARYIFRTVFPLVSTTGLKYIPPVDLRYRVSGQRDLHMYFHVGNAAVLDLERAFQAAGRDWSSFENVLDFGCGCGRVIGWIEGRAPHCNLYGTDIDAEAIGWCRQHMKFGDFRCNGDLPPLSYESDTFDLIFASSVFTHLSEDYQFAWLEELRRVTRPGGLLLLTVHGDYAAERNGLPPHLTAQWHQDGFLFLHNPLQHEFFPSYYQTTYHTPEYVADRWSRYLKVLAHIPHGYCNFQDLVVAQKEPGTAG